MDKLVLIDGNAILHRAFHALPPLANKNGEVVNAVFGFFSMFLKILDELKPQYIAVCFDKKAPTFRQKIYLGYQATRPKMADELASQIDILHNSLRNIGIPIFEVDGYEADDLIGTLAAQSQKSKIKNQKLETIIVSGDRDMLQLVNSHVWVLAPVVGITKMILFNRQKIEEKYGLSSHQMIDYKALVGDPSDNYPGVLGIGPKTASELLRKYGTLENIYKNLFDLPAKIVEKLSLDAEQVALAKKLATIVTDAPVNLKLQEGQDMEKFFRNMKTEFKKLGFKSLIARMEKERPDIKSTKKSKSKEKNSNQIELI